MMLLALRLVCWLICFGCFGWGFVTCCVLMLFDVGCLLYGWRFVFAFVVELLVVMVVFCDCILWLLLIVLCRAVLACIFAGLVCGCLLFGCLGCCLLWSLFCCFV